MIPQDDKSQPPELPQAANSTFADQLREINDALLLSSVQQHDLAAQATQATEVAQASNDQFEAIVDTAPFGLYLLDAQLRFRQVSQKSRLVFGDIGELIGRDFAEVVHLVWPEDTAREFVSRFSHTLSTGQPYISAEFSGVRYDRKVREYYDWEIHRITLPDGQYGVVCYFVDISARVLAQESSRENEERLRFVIDSMPQKILTAAADGVVDYFNPQWTEFTGLAFDDVAGRDWKHFVHPDDLAETVRLWAHAVRTGQPYIQEHRFRQSDGQYCWHLSRMLPLRDTDGKVVMWVGSNTDINEQRQTANELRRYADELSEADKKKNQFLATVAHELRNPLAPIRNAVLMLQLTNGNDEAVRLAASILDRQVGQMVRLVEDLLDVNRFTLGKIELRSKLLELASVVHHAVEAVEPMRRNLDQILLVNLPPEPIFLYADPMRLTQVLENLLTNACKFTHARGQISITVERSGGSVVITVQDNGIGLSAEHVSRIFDLFTQFDSSAARSTSGLGIGLSLVQNLVTLHGGSIEAHSGGVGHGSRFVVRLPNVVEVPPAPASGISTADRVVTTARRILVVDDNTDSANSMAALLQLSGNETQVAHDGLAAVETARVFRPEIILLDIGLPGISGYEACRRIRATDHGRNIVMIALTGMGEISDRRSAIEAGFDEHIVKPVAYRDLDKTLAKLTATSH